MASTSPLLFTAADRADARKLLGLATLWVWGRESSPSEQQGSPYECEGLVDRGDRRGGGARRLRERARGARDRHDGGGVDFRGRPTPRRATCGWWCLTRRGAFSS